MDGGTKTEDVQCVEDMRRFGAWHPHTTKAHIALSAAQRWTDVTAMALWDEQEQMMDIGGMVTIFVIMGESRGKYIEN